MTSEEREFTGLLHRVRASRLDWPIDFAAAADRESGRLVMVANGPGPELARRAMNVALEREAVSAIVSIGFCGALDPDLRVGDVVVGNKVIPVYGGDTLAAEAPRVNRTYSPRAVVSSDRVAVTVADRARLRNLGGSVVEMEAAAAAAVAYSRNLPFYCIKTVSDQADGDLVIDFNCMRGADGRISRGRIIFAALRRPFTAIPALLKLERDTRMAAQTLGDFLADCEF